MNHVLCDGGLCNRLNALLFALMLQRRYGQAWQISWPRNNWCGAAFDSLFSSPLPQDEHGIAHYKQHEARHLLLMHENQAGFDSAHWVPNRTLASWADYEAQLQRHDSVVYYNSLLPAFVTDEDVRGALSLLHVNAQVAEVARRFIAEQRIDASVLGVHIRKTDFGDRVDDQALFQQLQGSGRRAFVCSDDAAVNTRFAALPNCSVFDKTALPQKLQDQAHWQQAMQDDQGRAFASNMQRPAQAVREGLVDLLVLSQTEMLSTSHSTFLATAQRFARCGYFRVDAAAREAPPTLAQQPQPAPAAVPAAPIAPTPAPAPVAAAAPAAAAGKHGFSLFPTLTQMGVPMPRGVLQVGASYGQEMREFLTHGIRAGVFVEPLPQPHAHLAAVCAQIPNFLPVQALCAEAAGQTHTFHVASNGGMSSSLLKPVNHLRVNAHVSFPATVQLQSTTVTELLAGLRQRGHSPVVDSLDLLYMDTQGAEFKVLLGAVPVLGQFKYLYFEVMRNDMYEGQTPFLAYAHLLEALGFTLNNVYFCHPEQTGNALFIRKDLVQVAG